MPPQTLKGDGKRRTVKKSQHQLVWNFEMRQTLHILRTEFGLPSMTQERVFSIIFRDIVQQCGFTGDVPYKRLSAQWNDKRPKDWQIILAPATSDQEQTRRELIASNISATIVSLGIGPQRASVHQQQRSRPRLPPPPSQPVAADDTAIMQQLSRPTPLSRRQPIGFWDPDSQSQVQPQQTQDHVQSPKRLRITRQVAGVEVSRQIPWESTAVARRTSAKTPGSRTSKPKSPRNIVFRRPDDRARGLKPLLVTQDEYDGILRSPNPVKEPQAHPGVQSLLFRWFHEDSGKELHNMHSEQEGFIARKFSTTVRNVWEGQAPPPCDQLCWVDLYQHIDRHNNTSPFISTSNAFWWVLRLALKERKSGVRTGRIAIIDGTKLDQRSVYHVPPYWRELKKKFVFHNGAWRYGGSSEFLVWREIPRHAIISTFSVDQLYAWATSSVMINQALRLDLLSMPGDLKTKIIPLFRENGNHLTTEIAVMIAELARIIGLGITATVDQLSHLVTDVIQGWGIVLERRDSEHWRKLARVFAQAYSANADFAGSMKLMCAFLDGVRYASSKNFNTKHTPVDMAKMQKRAKLIGLENVAQTLSAELDAVKIMLFTQETKKDRLLKRDARAMIDDVQEDEEDEVVLRRTRRRIMVAESDGLENELEDGPDSGYDDDSEVFEFGTDGLVAA